MSIIKVKKKDEVNLAIRCDSSVAHELSDFFTFDVPNAKFHPMYRARRWDGKIRLFSMLGGELPVGLLEYVKSFAEKNEYEVDLSDYKSSGENITLDDTEKFCKFLKLTSQNKSIEVRDYQIDAINRGITTGRSLLISPTGSGKSLIIYCLMRWHMLKKRKQLIIVPTTSLVEQLKSDFEDYSTVNGWSSTHVGVIYSGHEKVNTKPIVISTWQSVFKLPPSFFDEFDVIYGDEAHLFKAKSLTTLFNKCKNTPYRIGTTGTLDGTQTHRLVLEGMFGPVYKVTTTKKLIDDNQLADLKIFCLQLNYTDEEKKIVKEYDYQKELDFVVTHERRNKFIRNLALKQKGNTLLLFQFVEKHGKVLYNMISEKAAEGRKIFFVFGGTDTETREEVRKLTETQDDAIIVASVGTFSTGINIRNLHNIIFASPSKSKIRNLQSVGRGLRKSDTKDTCTLFDIADDLSWKSRKNFLLLHMVERIKIYNEEKLDYTLVKVDI